MPALAASQDMPMDDLPDLFKSENTALDNARATYAAPDAHARSEEHTSELQSQP